MKTNVNTKTNAKAGDVGGSQKALRALYGAPAGHSGSPSLATLDSHCRDFIAHSPLVCVGSAGDVDADVRPRGDAPGFVQVLADGTLLIPDRPGSDRLDMMEDLVADPRVGLLFMIPGVDETLRVNGRARIIVDDARLGPLSIGGKAPRTGMLIEVDEAVLNAGGALDDARRQAGQ